MSEADVLAAIEKVVANVAIAYRFGYHEVEDIKQEGRCLALEVLAEHKYDGRRPLENFLFAHLCNRLSNFKRKHCRRNDPPCRICHTACMEGMPSSCPKTEGQGHCKTYRQWYMRNRSKQNLINLMNINDVGVDFATNQQSEFAELLKEADAQLSPQDRKTLLRLQAGEPVQKVKRERLRRALAELFKEDL